MNELENIQRYIERTKFKKGNRAAYCMRTGEWLALCRFAESSRNSVVDAINLAFEYGRAKGERHARREAAKKA